MAKKPTKSKRAERRPGPGPRFSEDQVAAALKATGAIFAHAAAWLTQQTGKACSRPAIKNYVDQSPKLQALVREINEVVLDQGEDLLKQHILNGSERSLHFLLQTKGKVRGYTKRYEPPPDTPPPQQASLKQFSVDLLKQLEAIAVARQQQEREGKS